MKLISLAFSKFCRAIVRHYSLHAPEHVGQFAGSLLPLEGWQHK